MFTVLCLLDVLWILIPLHSRSLFFFIVFWLVYHLCLSSFFSFFIFFFLHSSLLGSSYIRYSFASYYPLLSTQCLVCHFDTCSHLMIIFLSHFSSFAFIYRNWSLSTHVQQPLLSFFPSPLWLIRPVLCLLQLSKVVLDLMELLF